MNELFSSLKALLSSENKVIISLIGLSVKEEKALVKNDPRALVEITRLQKQDIGKLVSLEGRRAEIQQQLTRRLRLEEGALLRDILPYAGEERDELMRVSEELKKNYQKLHEQNAINRMLLRQSLNYVNRILQVLLPERETVYSSTGRVETSGETALLNKSV